MTIAEVTVDDLDRALAAGARLVDVREPVEYTAGHVAGAVLVPLSELEGRVADVRDVAGDGDLYVICKAGGRSLRAAEILATVGVTAVNVAGGTLAWMSSGRQVVAGDQPS